MKNKRKHLFDVNLPMSEIARFGPTDISMVNRQPSSIFRAHYEVYVSKELYRSPAVSTTVFPDSLIILLLFLQGSLNLWLAITWVYAAIEKLHKGLYGTYNCSDAVEYIFTPQLRHLIKNIAF